MAKTIHVSGASLLRVGPQGRGGGGLVELGIPVDGVDLSFELFFDDVIADSGGPNVPVDVIDQGKLAYITARLSIYDADVLESLMALGAAAGNLEPAAGTLLIANNRMRRLVIDSPLDGRPWRFPFVHLVSPTEMPKLSTRQEIPIVRFRALPGTGTAGTMKNLPLFDHIAT